MKRITRIEAAGEQRKKLRVAAYARVSTDSEEQMTSLETQMSHYERYIKARPDWEYAGLYYDEGVSGTHMERRDGLQRLLADCDRALIDYIVVKSISRFSRNTVDSIETVRWLCDKGIYIYFEKENIDTGRMEGELMLSILSSLAESESHSIAENERWAFARRCQMGTIRVSCPPYGYDVADGQLVVNETEAEVVREIFRAVLSGRSPGKIAGDLNARGVPTRKGGPWCRSTVSGMIRNERYTGDALMQKTYSDDQFRRHKNYGERARYYMRDHHEAIISREEFDAAGAILEANGREKGVSSDDKYQNRYAMSGRIRCAECGGTMKRVKLAGHTGYACTTHIKNRNACSMKTIREDAVQAAFVTMLNKLTAARSSVLVPLSAMRSNGANGKLLERLDDLGRQMDENIQRRHQLQQFFTKGLLDATVYADEMKALTQEADRIGAEQRRLQEEVQGDRGQQEALEQLLRFTAGKQMLTEYDPALFTAFVDHVVVCTRTEIGFAMKCGPVFRERI